MSQELEQIEEAPVEGVQHVEQYEQREYGAEDLLTFSRNMQVVYSFAQSLVRTPFVPAQYKGDPGSATAAIMAARGVGIMDPMAALRALDVIQGTPAFRANTLRGLAQSAGHEVWVEESTSERAIVKGRRRGEDRIQESLWDMDRARGLGLVGKDNWKKQPKAMLLARATSELVRLIASDMLLGLYSAEELGDGVVPAEVVEVVEAKPTVRRSRVTRKKPEPARAPQTAERVEDEAEAEPTPKEPGGEEPAPQEETEPDPAPTVEAVEPGAGDPGQPTRAELEEWGQLPADFT